MKQPAKLWEWEGEQLSAQQISAKAPIYSGVWIRRALKEGATCIADLHQKHAEGLARRKAGGAKGGDRTSWRGARACSTTRAG